MTQRSKIMRPLRLVVAFTLTTAASAQAGAQARHDSTSLLRPGARVRLTLSAEDARRTGHDLVKGTLVTADPERFIITPGERPGADTVATFTVDRVEVYAGRRSRRKMVVTGIAAGGIGALVFAGVNAISSKSRRHDCNVECKPSLSAVWYVVPVAVGAVFGSTSSLARWVTVPRPTAELGVGFHSRILIGSKVSFR